MKKIPECDGKTCPSHRYQVNIPRDIDVQDEI